MQYTPGKTGDHVASHIKGAQRYALLLAAAGLMTTPLPALGQEAAPPSQLPAPITGEATCLAFTPAPSPYVREDSQGKPIYLVVAASEASELLARDYARIDCAATGYKDAGVVAAYRDQICRIAFYGDISIYNQFASAVGARPDTLCKSVEQLAGKWPEPVNRYVDAEPIRTDTTELGGDDAQ